MTSEEFYSACKRSMNELSVESKGRFVDVSRVSDDRESESERESALCYLYMWKFEWNETLTERESHGKKDLTERVDVS